MGDDALRNDAKRLPSDWKLVSFEDCCTRVADNRDPRECKGKPYLGLEHLQAGFPALLGVGDGSDISSAKTAFRNNDILFGKLRPYLRKGLRVGFDGVCSTDIFAFRTKPETRSDFLGYLIHTDAFVRQAIRTTSGVNHPRTSWDGLRRFLIARPPLDEQRQIAALLSAVQRGIERQERLIELTDELKKALMQKLFTEGTRGEPQKETDTGPVPESWEIVPLGSIAKIGNGSTPKRDNADYWEGGTVPWLTSGKIHEGHITKPDEYVTKTAKAACHLPLVAAGSLLIAITGEGKTLGNAALVEFETCVSQHLAYVQFHQANVVPGFLLYFLQSRYAHLRQMSVGAGSTKKALTCGLLKRYEVPLPHQDEQMAIASTLDAVIAKLQGHKRAADSLRSLFRTLLHELMTGQIRVHGLGFSALEEADQEPVGAV